MLRRAALLALIPAAFAAIPTPPAFHLPDGVIPKKQIVEITVDPGQPSFEGWMRIQAEIEKPTRVIWLDAKDITPLEASVNSRPATAEPAGDEFLAIELDSPVARGPATISIHYRARLDDKSLAGAYRRKINGAWYAFTTFTPIEARRAFPCFDELRFKTAWELTIHVKREDKAFSNAPETGETEEPGGMKAVHFAPTAPLAAEVVAFAVGPFDVIDAGNAGTPMRVIAPKGQGEYGTIAAQNAGRLLPVLESYTGIPYAFGKLDHIAVPDGTFGAVENPGLITYLASRLLIPPGGETAAKIHDIRAVEAHEMAHQWFGDLVTQASWQDVWLSEGFADWLSMKIMDQDEPAWRRGLAGVVSRERMMRIDISPRARPVRLPMNSRAEIEDAYSRIVYDKGAAILSMLEGWLGGNKLRDGLRAYLRDHEFGSASTADLESSLRRAAGTDPAAVMDSFLGQTGVPEIRGEVRCGRGGVRIRIEQENAVHRWAVPVCWRSDGAASGCTVVSEPREIKLPKKSACPAWVYFNTGGTGYYRTNWSTEQMKSLARALPRLTAAERLTLAYDLRRMQPSTESIALLSKLDSDPEPEVVVAASGG